MAADTDSPVPEAVSRPEAPAQAPPGQEAVGAGVAEETPGDEPKGRGHGKQKSRKRGWEHVRSARRANKRKKLEATDTAVAKTGNRSAKRSANAIDAPYTAEEIAAEERKPKRKVAVMVGYAGTGYLGMQLNPGTKTIEGDLFAAFVAAGAISKANADDPKKSSFLRCARTDKGVHAAGNVISLKLIVEDEDIVDRINDNLPDQIRVWGMQRTNNGFSCYTACDSRWYEYLLPSYTLLPPHPDSFLGKEMLKAAKETGTHDEMSQRLDDVKDFWDDVEKGTIRPMLATLDPELREEVMTLLRTSDGFKEMGYRNFDDIENRAVTPPPEAPVPPNDPPGTQSEPSDAQDVPEKSPAVTGAPGRVAHDAAPATPAEAAFHDIRKAYVAAKRRYRITPPRLQKLQAALDQYKGTNNFHNYTVQKGFGDPSAQRVIKSFIVNPQPVQIRDTEWLSLKVHGQSFMMHQIRKMVAMVAMVVRCGAPLDIIPRSYGKKHIAIPKAPSLGLLLERPVFDSYNRRAVENLGREPIDFGNYEDRINEFKDREIYSRMWDTEENHDVFHSFFHQLDHYNTSHYLWATAGGWDAVDDDRPPQGSRLPAALEDGLEDGDENPEEGEG